MNKLFAGVLLSGLAFAGFAAPAEAGCLTGAAVGGVAGHVAGHHALLGAAAGCAIGHHEAVVHRREEAERSGADRATYGRDAYRDDQH